MSKTDSSDAKNLFKTDRLTKFQNLLSDAKAIERELGEISDCLLYPIERKISKTEWLGMKICIAAVMYQGLMAAVNGLSASKIHSMPTPKIFLGDCLDAEDYEIDRAIKLLQRKGRVAIDIG